MDGYLSQNAWTKKKVPSPSVPRNDGDFYNIKRIIL